MAFGYGFDYNSFRPAVGGPMGGGTYPYYPTQQPMPYPGQGATTLPFPPAGSVVTPGGGVAAPVEESYVENILRLNRGKKATFYMTYENNKEWNAKIFTGVIEAAGRDHIIISDPNTGMRFLLLTLNLDYVTFEGPINYQYPFQGGVVTNLTPVSPSAAGTATLGTVTGR